jgi:hypothetical protein
MGQNIMYEVNNEFSKGNKNGLRSCVLDKNGFRSCVETRN